MRWVRISLLFWLACAVLWVLWPPTRVLARAGGNAVWQWGTQDPRKLFHLALPAFDQGAGRPLAACRHLFARLAGVDLSSRAHLLASQLPVSGRVPDEPSRAARRPPAPTATATLAAGGNGHALVGIYHTHTGETYALSDGVARLDGQEGGVVTVGRALAAALAARGVAVVHNTKIHDVPYPRSYLASRETAEEMLRAHPGVVAMLDIHRDAAKTRKQSVVRIHGEPVATILLVVGSDAREPFPTWRQNRVFAERLAAALNGRYPGLCQGVRVKSGRYNQFLHPHALLVEIGSVENRTEEAVRAAELFAEVLADQIRQAQGREKTP